jgi:hypothetical protein
MGRFRKISISLCCLSVFICIQCTDNHRQRDFEKQAFSKPSRIEEMTADGKHKSGTKSDPSDWRTAPMFTGLFEVTTSAYPNPASFNSSFTILINVKAVNAISSLSVYAFQQPANFRPAAPFQIEQLNPGLNTITIFPKEFAQESSTGNYGNIYRIILLDNQQNIITYGDIRVK